MIIGAIVQARTGSSRFPNKILRELPFNSGITVLENVINRLKLSKRINLIIIATTNSSKDDIIERIAQSAQVEIFRGSENDVLSRYFEAASKFNIDIVIRITSDCPCIDPKLIDELIDTYSQGEFDYINLDTEKFPRGLDAEIFSNDILTIANKNAKNLSDREHVTKYIYSHPQDFSIFKINPAKKYLSPKTSRIRITVDTFFDYLLLCAVFTFLNDKENYGLADILKVFEDNPWLYLLNEHIRQKMKYISLEQEFENVIPFLKLNDFNHSAEILNFLHHHEKERNDVYSKIEKFKEKDK